MVTAVRRRGAWDVHRRRGRATDIPWADRRLLTCNLQRLSGLACLLGPDPRLRHRARRGLGNQGARQTARGHPNHELPFAWDRLAHAVKATKMPEEKSLFQTLKAWRRELLTFARTRVTNAKTEAAHVTAKNVKGAVRGLLSHANYRARILILTPAKTAALNTLSTTRENWAVIDG